MRKDERDGGTIFHFHAKRGHNAHAETAKKQREGGKRGGEMFGTWRREIHYAARDERSGKERFIRRDNNEMNVAVVASSSRLRFRAFSRIPDRKSRHKSANILLSLAAGRHRRRAETARAVRGN